jgi:hypothetical protein
MWKLFYEIGFVSFIQYYNYYAVEISYFGFQFWNPGPQTPPPEKWPPQQKFDYTDIDFYVVS